ncbi:MAG: hypothetical protein AB7F32_02140 [Victivallaceae bacterium]
MKQFFLATVLIALILIPGWDFYTFFMERRNQEARDRINAQSDIISIDSVALAMKQHNRYIAPYQLYLSDEVDIRHFISQKDRESREFVNKWLQNKHDQKIPENIFNTLCVLKIDYDANRSEVTIRSQAVPGRLKTIILKKDSVKPN